jgi:dTDP-4-dehydrorhamnose 3,5-epimerase
MQRMKTADALLEGLLVFEPKAFGDNRGFFLESYHRQRYARHGLDVSFVQDNHSRSGRGVLRGLHFQTRRPQGKLIRVARGAIYDVAVDVRPGSPTFGQHFATELTEENHRQLYIGPGFAHGFCVLSDVADVIYKCTDYYDPADEGGVLWNDADLGIAWPVDVPQLSDKDRRLPRLRELKPDQLPLARNVVP